MMLIKNLNDLHRQFQKPSLALGTFDGVHLAHQYVIKRTTAWSTRNSGTSMVFTFSNHPLSIIHPHKVPPQLQTKSEKIEQIRRLGVDVLVCIPFTRELLHLQPEDFVQFLAYKIKPSHIVVGPNYSFGDKGRGTPQMLHEMTAQYDIETEICGEIMQDGVLVSSTYIRQLLSAGDVDGATKLLGRPYDLAGTVVHGNQRGRSLGFPTANLNVPSHRLIPGRGVYAVRVKVGRQVYSGLCNIGFNPTFGQELLRIETHILNFDRDIYGKKITLYFLGRLRQEMTFSSVEGLVYQMNLDLQKSRLQYFASDPT